MGLSFKLINNVWKLLITVEDRFDEGYSSYFKKLLKKKATEFLHQIETDIGLLFNFE